MTPAHLLPPAGLTRARLTTILTAGLALVGGGWAEARTASRLKPNTATPTPSTLRRLEAWTAFPCFMGSDGRAIGPARTAVDVDRIRVAVEGGKRRVIDASGLDDGSGGAPNGAPSAPPGGAGVHPGSPTPTAPTAAPGRFAGTDIDTFRVAMIRIDFETDRSGDSTTTPDGRFDLRTDVSLPVDPPPHNRDFYAAHGRALANYYRAQSDGHLELDVSVFPPEPDAAYRLGDMADYGPWAVVVDDVDVALEAETLLKDALTTAHASGQIDMTAFDAFILVHAGSDFQSDVNQDSPNDLPTFVLEFGDSVNVGGKHITRCMLLPETTTQDGFFGALNGVLAHEFGHILGLPDLYSTRTGFPMVGHFSIMDSGHNIGAILVDEDSSEVEVVGALPTSFDAWCRLQLFLPDDAPGGGFLGSRIEFVEDSLAVDLGAVLLDHRLIFCPIHDTEYYLVENRAIELDGNGFPIIRADPATGVILGPIADSTLTNTSGALEYDALLPSGGLLVWHIDDRVLFGDLADPFGVNTNINRRGVKLVEADGIEDQGRRNFGTPWDPFYVGNNAVFGPFTLPATTTNDNQFSRITLATTSEPDPVMDVRMRRGTGLRGWPIGLNEDFTITSTGLLDVTGDGSPEMLIVVGRDILAVEGRGGRPFPPLDDLGATPWVRGPAALDRRLASGVIRDDEGGGVPYVDVPIVAALSTGADRIVAWRADGRPLPADPIRPATGASTPPAVIESFQPWSVAYAGYDGRAHLAGGLLAFGRRADTEAFQADSQPDPGSGNVLVGALSGDSGATDVAWATESGRVHIATTAGATPGAGPDGTLLLRTLGSTSGPIADPRDLSLLAANFRASASPEYQIAAIGRNGTATLLDLSGATLPGWPVSLPAPLVGHAAAGDLDGEGLAELVLADTLGNLQVLNGDGSNALHFPMNLGARATGGPMMADVDGEPGFEILIMTVDGSLHALTRAGREATGFPIGLGGDLIAGNYLADFNADGRLDVVAGSPAHLLIGFSLDAAIPDSLIAWRGEDNGPTRNAVLDRRHTGAWRVSEPSAEARSLICFPNPARGDRMSFRITLAAGQTMQASVYDLTGSPVQQNLSAADSGPEATAVWHLAGVAPGVYLVRVDVTGPNAPASQVRLVSVLK